LDPACARRLRLIEDIDWYAANENEVFLNYSVAMPYGSPFDGLGHTINAGDAIAGIFSGYSLATIFQIFRL
jgi:hypothetical protein